MSCSTEKLENEAIEWLELVANEELDRNRSLQDILKDGTILCK